MKVVIDTNVVISALFFGGKPQELLRLVLEKVVVAYTSPSITDEYIEVVNRIAKKYPHKTHNFSIYHLISHFQTVYPLQKIEICRDKDDNKFIECASEARCLYIISGDDDLLSLKQVDSVEIITVSEFFERFHLSP